MSQYGLRSGRGGLSRTPPIPNRNHALDPNGDPDAHGLNEPAPNPNPGPGSRAASVADPAYGLPHPNIPAHRNRRHGDQPTDDESEADNPNHRRRNESFHDDDGSGTDPELNHRQNRWRDNPPRREQIIIPGLDRLTQALAELTARPAPPPAHLGPTLSVAEMHTLLPNYDGKGSPDTFIDSGSNPGSPIFKLSKSPSERPGTQCVRPG